jgi:cytochrome c oxidase subunit 3
MIKKIPFHLVEKRPWPIFVSFSLLGLLFNSVLNFHKIGRGYVILIFLLFFLFSVVRWWAKVSFERNLGFHKDFVLNKFYVGMLILIISEVFFFFRFFWGFFHNCWFPNFDVGGVWPPFSFNSIMVDSFSLPFLKTVILLSSGVTITWRHFRLITKDFFGFTIGLGCTVVLGIIFLFFQTFEYSNSFFGFKTLIFGSCFYLLTGFHGGHVIVGTVFLIVCFIRSYNFQFKNLSHARLILAIWYWHFVDVVWLFLFIFLYWYTSNF